MNTNLAVIVKHCGNIEERIKACKTRAIAETLKEQMCSELGYDCTSEVIVNFLNNIADGIINSVFTDKSTKREKNEIIE